MMSRVQGLTNTDRDVEPERAPASDQRPAGATTRRWWPDVLAVVSYASLSCFVTSKLWADPERLLLLRNRDDHGFFLFVLAHGERVVFHGASPLFSDRLNAPVGVNMMANTSMLALSIPMAPVTHVFGPAVAVALLITVGLAGTAAAWYWVLSRHMVDSRAAAWVGGLWGGFAPGWISHASGQVNFVSNVVIPFIVWQVLRLREPGRVWRGGVALGLLVAVQLLINEEILLLTALALAAMTLAYAVLDFSRVRSVAPRFVGGGLVAAAVATVLMAYPLYYQFFGPGHYRGLPFDLDRHAVSLWSLVAYPRQSIAGNEGLGQRLSRSASEDSTFWGPFGCVMIVISVVLLWRSVAARAAAFAALLLLGMSFGAHLRFTAADTRVPAPFGWIKHLPVLNLVTIPRYALASTVIVGVLLALAADRVVRLPGRRRLLFGMGLVLALVPLTPKPLPTVDAAPMPAFFARQMWRPYVHGYRTVVTVPLPDLRTGRDSMRMATLSNLAFPVPRGYFLAPKDPPADRTGSWAAPRRYTVSFLNTVRRTGVAPKIGPWRRDRVRADLAYWRAAVVVLMPDTENGPALQKVITGVLGPPQEVGGVQLWDVRTLEPAPIPPRW